MRVSVSTSTELVASSRIRMRGSANIARAKQITCRWPSDSRAPRGNHPAGAGMERPAVPVAGAGDRRLPGAGRGRVAGGADPVRVSVWRVIQRDPVPGPAVRPGAGGDGGRGARVRAAGPV